MSEDTPKKGKQGFASNPENINRGGRPRGSRNKSTLLRAQLRMDSATEQAAELLEAIMNNDKDVLGIKDDVPMSLRLTAIDKILNKSIANEKEKDPQEPAKTEKEEEDDTPMFSPTPVKGAALGN